MSVLLEDIRTLDEDVEVELNAHTPLALTDMFWLLASFTIETISSTVDGRYTFATLLHAGKPSPSKVLYGMAEMMSSKHVER